jgi:hypothetical protein
METQIAYGLLTAIQHRAGIALNDVPVSTARVKESLLLRQLNSDKASPDIELFDFSPLLDRLDLAGLFGDGDSGKLRDRLERGIEQLGDLRELAKNLLAGDDVATVRGLVEKLGGISEGGLPVVIAGILRRQVGIGISFMTTLKNLATPGLPENVVEGWKDYFFREGGFETIDGIQIIAPGHAGLLATLKPADLNLEGLGQSLKGLRGLINERRAEQYVRDMVRIVVEVAGDVRYRLADRRTQLMGLVSDQAKAARWFKGAASMAESLVTSAVEEACLGVAQFQTNPVLAASAATYAGTAARKATQHVFLSEIPIPM